MCFAYYGRIDRIRMHAPTGVSEGDWSKGGNWWEFEIGLNSGHQWSHTCIDLQDLFGASMCITDDEGDVSCGIDVVHANTIAIDYIYFSNEADSNGESKLRGNFKIRLSTRPSIPEHTQ